MNWEREDSFTGLPCVSRKWMKWKWVALGFITHFAPLKVEQRLGATNVCA